ncbi:hypothetical protein GOP47_0001503 [Adiantum capillus-veneris]|uniref:ENT domain-containing protein n=1 Tax=Adiantum capillus-veneris TaxID=13818 RepID=A0A9D4ZQS5_ADICA|nr:hypothetical protein GOP47_0001503 [Adiantum capillus-veneris]
MGDTSDNRSATDLRKIQARAYIEVARAFIAAHPEGITWAQEILLVSLRLHLEISIEKHQAIISELRSNIEALVSGEQDEDAVLMNEEHGSHSCLALSNMKSKPSSILPAIHTNMLASLVKGFEDRNNTGLSPTDEFVEGPQLHSFNKGQLANLMMGHHMPESSNIKKGKRETGVREGESGPDGGSVSDLPQMDIMPEDDLLRMLLWNFLQLSSLDEEVSQISSEDDPTKVASLKKAIEELNTAALELIILLDSVRDTEVFSS